MKTKSIFQKTIVIITMFVFVLFAFNSCSKDDDSDPTPTPVADAIVGTWNAVSLKGTGNTTLPLLGTVINATATGSNLNCNLVITENPNNITSSGSFDLLIQYSRIWPDLPLTNLPFDADGTWSRSGADLAYTLNDINVTAGDVILNDNGRELVITFSELHGSINILFEVKFARKV